MIKKSKRYESSASGIKRLTEDDAILKFSFKLFDGTDNDVCPEEFERRYTRTLMERLRDLSSWKVSDFVNRYHKTIRNHGINWEKTTRPEGFTHLNDQYKAYPAYQFSLSVNAYGRVHGLIIDDTFYVIWLDCGHNLYA